MKIAIDIREAGHEKTGKGWFTYNIVHELLTLAPQHQFLLYTDAEAMQAEGKAGKKNPFSGFKHAEIKVIEQSGLKWHLETLKDLKKQKPDVFFAPTSYIIPSLAPKSLKVIITVHDLVAFLYPQNHTLKAVAIERLTLRRALKKAEGVFVVSENTRKDLLARFKYPEKQISQVSCAPAEFFKEKVSAAELERFKEKMKLPEKFILAVGTLEPRKNFGNLMKSFVIVKRKFPDYKLVIVGKKGWKFAHIEETLKKYELEKDVIFPGYLPDTELRMMYHLAKVFVFPSLYEGFGIPPLEAMACGCAVVSSNVASLPEVIGDAGILINPRIAIKIADAIISLLENDKIRLMMVERGLHRAEHFSWHKSALKALEGFERARG